MSRNVIEVDDSNFQCEILESKVPVLVEFGATWCPPCRALEPVVAAFADESVGTYKVAKMDTDEAVETAARYGVRGVPTLIAFKNGERVAQHVGLTTKAKLIELFRS